MSPRLALFFAVLALAAQLCCVTAEAAPVRLPSVDARPTAHSRLNRRNVLGRVLSLSKEAKGMVAAGTNELDTLAAGTKQLDTLAAGTKQLDTLATAPQAARPQAAGLREAESALREAQIPIGELRAALKQAQADVQTKAIDAIRNGVPGRADPKALMDKVIAADKALQGAKKRGPTAEPQALAAGTKQLDTLATAPRAVRRQAARLHEAERALRDAQIPIGELRAALKQAQADVQTKAIDAIRNGVPGRADPKALMDKVIVANKALQEAKKRRPIAELQAAVKAERASLIRTELNEKKLAMVQEALLHL